MKDVYTGNLEGPSGGVRIRCVVSDYWTPDLPKRIVHIAYKDLFKATLTPGSYLGD